MATNPHRPWRRTLALTASLAAHAALVGALFLLPAGAEPSAEEVPNSEVTEGGMTVRLDLPRRRNPPGYEPPGAIESSFEVRLKEPHSSNSAVSPLPTPMAPVARPGPTAAPTPGGGSGPAAALAVPGEARSVVFLLDRSASMGLHGAWTVARQATLAAIRALPAGTRFQLIPYSRQAEPLTLAGSGGLVAISAAAVEDAARLLAALSPSGSTDHVHALHRGLLLRPDALLLITDAADMNSADVAAITAFNRGCTIIDTVEVTVATHQRPDNPLARLASQNSGTYRRLSPEGGLAAAP
jgi:hypothetical protein